MTRQYIALVGHYWGAGETPALALRAARKAGGRMRLHSPHIFELPLGTKAAQVDGLGRFWWEWHPDAPDTSDTHCRELTVDEVRIARATPPRRNPNATSNS